MPRALSLDFLSPVSGTTAQLDVLADDDGGEAALTYSWAVRTGPAGVGFAVNGTNAAKSVAVTFTRAGG